jgi:tetratricopeptide (TPR) repeat protein
MLYAYGDTRAAACSRDNYERALKIDPQLPEAQLARGLYEQYIAKDLDQAMPDFEAVVRLRPNSPPAHTALGRALRKSGRMDEALAHFQRAWELDPLSNGGSHMVLTTLAGLRRLPELLAARRLYQQRFPSMAYARIEVARTEGLIQHSLEPLRLALRQYGGTLTPAEHDRAEALLAREEGRYLDAARLIAASRVEDPDELLDRDVDLGFLYWAAGKQEESQRRFRSAEQRAQALLKQDPGETGPLEPLALAQSMLGEHAAALAAIDRRRMEYPEDRDPVNGPGMSFLRSIILVRAGRAAEGYAEVARLLRVPFGSPMS